MSSALIVDGKSIASEILADVREKVLAMRQKPKLVAILVGDNAASVSFLEQKKKKCEAALIEFTLHKFEEKITTTKLRAKVRDIRAKSGMKSIIVQLPLPAHINTQYILDAVPPGEDVDMLSSRSKGLLATGKSKILPPTAAAILEILKRYEVNLASAHCVVVGLGPLVGKPLFDVLADKVASMTLVHAGTLDISRFIREADILIAGTGKPRLITGDMVKEGVVALDAGYARIGDTIMGDLDYASVREKARIITPVPGGIGPITVAMLIKNIITLAHQ